MPKPKPAAARRGNPRTMRAPKFEITVIDNDVCPICRRPYTAADRPAPCFGATIDERLLAYQKAAGRDRLNAAIKRQIDTFTLRYFAANADGRKALRDKAWQRKRRLVAAAAAKGGAK